jgi:aspartokinase
VNGTGIEAFGGIEFENAIGTQHVDRAHFRDHVLRDLAHDLVKALGDRGINIKAITTSEIKISVLIAEEYTELAVRVLHTAYGLDETDAGVAA